MSRVSAHRDGLEPGTVLVRPLADVGARGPAPRLRVAGWVDRYVRGWAPDHKRLHEIDVLGAAVAGVVLHPDPERELLLATWDVAAGDLR